MAITAYNIESDLVKVFPVTRRLPEYQKDARFFSENNVTNITNKLISNNYRENGLPYRNFVITQEINSMADPIEFCIQGYYFKISQVQDIIDLFGGTAFTDLYAFIRLDELNDLVEIAGQDEIPSGDTEYRYTGLYFSSSYEEGDRDYTVKLLTQSDNVISLASESISIIDASVVDITVIDGGDLDQQ